jgi:hypothetical protein
MRLANLRFRYKMLLPVAAVLAAMGCTLAVARVLDARGEALLARIEDGYAPAATSSETSPSCSGRCRTPSLRRTPAPWRTPRRSGTPS